MRFIFFLSPHFYFLAFPFYIHSTYALGIGNYAVSEKAPLAAILQRNSSANEAVDTLLWHFQQVGHSATRSSCTKSIIRNRYDDDIRARWPERQTNVSGCFTELQLKGHGTKVWQSMSSILGALNNSAAHILSDANVGWSGLDALDAFQKYSDKNCSLLKSVGIRVNGTWYLRVRVTAIASKLDIPRKPHGSVKSMYLTEFVTRDTTNGNLVSIQRLVNDTFGNAMPSATTLLTVTRPACSCSNVGEGPKGRQRLFDFNRWLLFAEQTLLASNVGALFLPLLLALLPLPLFSDTDTLVLILYTLFTDVCNVIPLAFKGAELIFCANNPPRYSQSEVFGLDVLSHIGVAETTVMGCVIRGNLPRIGISLIVVALLAMVLGIYLEVYPYRKRYYRGQKIELKNSAISNSMLLYLWAHERRCTQCSCYGEIYHERLLLQLSKQKRARRINVKRYIPGIDSLLHYGEVGDDSYLRRVNGGERQMTPRF